jgi:hypothetical protein
LRFAVSTDRAAALCEIDESLYLEPYRPASAHIEDIIRRLETANCSPLPVDPASNDRHAAADASRLTAL